MSKIRSRPTNDPKQTAHRLMDVRCRDCHHFHTGVGGPRPFFGKCLFFGKHCIASSEACPEFEPAIPGNPEPDK